MQSPANAQEFEDLGSHRRMWNAFTSFMLRGIIAVVALLLFLGWITGVL